MHIFSARHILSFLNALAIVHTTTREGTVFVCSQTETINATLFSGPGAGLAECVTQCLSQSKCMTGHICTGGDGTETCSLGPDWPPGKCLDLPTNENCSSFKLVNPCKHDGVLKPDGKCCTCVHNWYDCYCDRYRYDCSEAKTGILHVVQPKGYDTAFLMPCIYPKNMVLGIVQWTIEPGELNVSLATFKVRFSPRAGSQVIGLEYIHALTQQGEYRLTVNLNWVLHKIAVYDNFTLHGEDTGYAFSYGMYRPDLSNFGDGFGRNDFLGAGSLQGVPFSSNDNDRYGCVAKYGASWWYDSNCGPVIVYNPLNKRGKWPSDAFNLVNVPTIGFALELIRYY